MPLLNIRRNPVYTFNYTTMYFMNKCFVTLIPIIVLCGCAVQQEKIATKASEERRLETIVAPVSEQYKEKGGAGAYSSEYQHMLAVRPVPGGTYVTLEPKGKGNEKTFVEFKVPPAKVTVTEVTNREITVFFKSNSSKLSAEAMDLIKKVGESSPDVVKVSVSGYTDSRGKRPSNEALSKERSDFVVNALVESGVSVKSIVSDGYASDSPIADNESASGRAKNRRVEIKIVGAEKVIKAEQKGVSK
jgi:outer membrane protein OmpA-like peptidoglycan-associated protein